MKTKALMFASLLGLVAGDAAAARIYVKIEDAGIGTGACSLQEAIYSSVLHDTLDGGMHGIAIDKTDQGNPPDHFITTGCVMGDGNDTIVLPTRGALKMKNFLDGDAYNPYGPTATPLIFSTITIEGNGATLQWDPNTGDPQNARLFAIGVGFIRTPNGTASGTGSLTLRNVHVTGFHVKGGDGTDGGGGGLGAGGAVYVHNGASIVVENSTFEGNQAIGGNGAGIEKEEGGGGGGLSGDGGKQNGGSGGGGGARDGGVGTLVGGGGGGGGTVFPGGVADLGGSGGYLCGGNGGSRGNDGANGKCPGGGGGGSGDGGGGQFENSTGGNGAYGGGGGGGFVNGGNGGFGGGGGGGNSNSGADGGDGGFGGGGGTADDPGTGGPFGGNASGQGGGGGGGGALGGAIFSDHGAITVRNSTFTNNSVARGVGAAGGGNGGDSGGAIFSHDGDVTILNSTFSGNQSTGSGGAVVAYMDPPDSDLFGGPDIFINFTVENTIIANNGANECFFTGNVHAQGTHNLIMSNGSGSQPFGPCADPAVTEDPQLGALDNNGGYTKTMAIPFGSVAMGAADDAKTSLTTDQRGASRPQAGGFDIGAFEVCRIIVGKMLLPWPCSEMAQQDPPIFLTMLASSGGTTDPVAGSYPEMANTVVPLHATPASGYYFTSWTGNVATPTSASTTVIMSEPQTVGANFQLHDFDLSRNPTTLTIPLGGVGSAALQATALGNFADKVTLSATGTPAGVSTSFSANPLAPVPGTPASAIFKLTVGASARPGTFTETLKGSSTGLSGALAHMVPLDVTLVATAGAIVDVIGQQQALGCLDPSGIAQSLTSKMNAYQSLASGGHVQGAANVLGAFQYEAQAQIGHHIVTSCTDSVTDTAFSPGDTLIADAQSLQATLATSVKVAPIVGSVISTVDAGTAGRTVNLLSGKTVVATATTDAVGFYYIDTAALKAGAQYSASVTIPKGYKASSPASQTFTWNGKSVQLATFTLN